MGASSVRVSDASREVVHMSTLIDRLEGVRETGPSRWIARCPSHDDRSPSLSIRELDDGRILLHDFGGCHVSDVLSALGMEMTDLFPERLSHHLPPTHSRIPASDLLKIIADEALTVGVIAGLILDDRDIDEDEWSRLSLAVRRIGEARSHATS